jgi:hypothetical protein
MMTVFDAKFEVFMGTKIQVVALWAVKQCSDVVGYQNFGGQICLHRQDEVIILPFVLCGCETWSVSLREEHGLSQKLSVGP